ncbi:O-antigen ligase family protein [Winogradskyella sediminis]|uniref:O-antigen ligase family protein n=1 Tax=Winogradskyella sediminis TaxID=1382466 RepID=UPI003AA983A4
MKLLVFLIKWGFPLLLVTDLGSEFLSSNFVLNISRVLRILILVLLIKEYVLNFQIIRKFKLHTFFMVFLIVLFLYLFTDRDLFDGFWVYSKILYWVLGVNILFAYGYRGVLTMEDFTKVLKRVIYVAVGFSLIFFITGFIKDDYNVAAYLILFMYPLLLFSSYGYKKNVFFIVLSAFAILITLKRGAMIAFVAGNIVYYLGNLNADFSFKKLFTGLIILLSISFAGLTYFQLQEDEVGERFEEDQFDPSNERAGSGRIGAYTRIYDLWYNSDNKMFGFGNQEDTYRNVGKRTHAHSDIFGFLYNFGIVGILLIIWLYIKVIGFYFYYRKYDRENSVVILSLFAIMVLVNFYSGMLRTTNVLYFFSVFPYLQLRVMFIKQQQQQQQQQVIV